MIYLIKSKVARVQPGIVNGFIRLVLHSAV